MGRLRKIGPGALLLSACRSRSFRIHIGRAEAPMNPLLPPTTNSDSVATRRCDSGVPDIYAHRPLRARFGVVALVIRDNVRSETGAQRGARHLHQHAARPLRRLSRRITL